MKTRTLFLAVALLFAAPALAEDANPLPLVEPAVPSPPVVKEKRVAPPSLLQPNAPYEAAVAAKDRTAKGTPIREETERTNYPVWAYADTYATWEIALAEAAKIAKDARDTSDPSTKVGFAPTAGGSPQAPFTVYDIGAFSAISYADKVGLSTHAGTAGLAIAGLIFFIDTLLPTKESVAKDAYKARVRPLVTPSITFLHRAPPATGDESMSIELRSASRVISDLDLQCEPALLHISINPPEYMGLNISRERFSRPFVCGYGAGENTAIYNWLREVRPLTVTNLRDGDTLVRFQMFDLPSLARMDKVLPNVPDKEMGRAIYEKVRGRLPTDWMMVFTAPNAKGDLAVYAARGDVVLEFPPIPKP